MPKWGWGVILTLFSIKLPLYERKYVQHDFPRGTSYLNTVNYSFFKQKCEDHKKNTNKLR